MWYVFFFLYQMLKYPLFSGSKKCYQELNNLHSFMNTKVQKLSVSLDEENVKFVDEVLGPMNGLRKRSTVLNKLITDYRKMLQAQQQIQQVQQTNPLASMGFPQANAPLPPAAAT